MALGEDVTSIETTLKLAGASLIESFHPRQQKDMSSQYHRMNIELAEQTCSPLDGGLRLAQGSAADLDCLNQGAGMFKGLGGISQRGAMRQDGSSSKRKRVDSSIDTERCRSRDQMPPPPIPIHQPFVYKDRASSSDLHTLNSHDQFHATRFQRASIPPHRQLFEGLLSPSMPAPSLSMERHNMSLAGARANNGQSHVDRHETPRGSAGIAEPVYERGGWQTPPDFSNIRRSGSYSSPSSSLPSTGQPPVRRSKVYQQGNLMFPIDLGARTIDPMSCSYQSVSSDGSLPYHKRQSAFDVQSQLESAAPSRNHTPSLRAGRITLSRTPSVASQHSSKKSIGLFNHVRSSSRHTDHQPKNSSSHRQQLVIAPPAHRRVVTSPHFSTRQPIYSTPLPFGDGSYAETFRHCDSFDSAPTPVNSKMRPFSSTNGESYLLAQDPRAVIRGRTPFAVAQAPGFRRRANR